MRWRADGFLAKRSQPQVMESGQGSFRGGASQAASGTNNAPQSKVVPLEEEPATVKGCGPETGNAKQGFG
jgi:hypothetical protein